MSSALDGARSTVRNLGEEIGGYKVEILRGGIMMKPVRPVHNKTLRLVWNALAGQLDAGWEFVSDVRVPSVELDSELCPDLALIPAAEEAKNLAEYPPDLIEIAIEVVSPSSVRHDYEDKAGFHATAGIPLYVLFDPYRAACTWLWTPQAGEYQDRQRRTYGAVARLSSTLGELTVDTGTHPTDPQA
ncbi:Uma2 family endonuclease [Spiractinospora alimapuensis]|uniref:Uma2 family endonuclease n=1 Tax=Spiractinospora alimapuensis TaxID=2820884 RepID=UPI001F3E2A86|nr:Uma2 family endonuclease [Spiractinospora alimapuensis]QVQ53018.1 Uma2 family endonuclease [Spiractinospora alimapuensis]